MSNKNQLYFFNNQCQRFFWQEFLLKSGIKLIDGSVICCLMTYANNKTNKCFPMLETVSEKLGISKPTLINAIKRLEKKGFLTVKRKKESTAKNKPNLYDLTGFKKEFFKEYRKSNSYKKSKKKAKVSKKTEKPKQIELNEVEKRILNKWNSLRIVKHKKTPPDYEGTSFKSALQKLFEDGYGEKEIINSLNNYKEILKSEDYYFSYSYEGLTKFLIRGFYQFVNREIAIKNFKTKKQKQTQGIYDPDLKFDVKEYYVNRQDDFKEG